MPKQAVTLKVDQLPSYQAKNVVMWLLSDHDCNLTLKRVGGRLRLSGEWIEWDDDGQDWTERPMTLEEVKEVVSKVNPVLPVKGGVAYLKDNIPA